MAFGVGATVPQQGRRVINKKPSNPNDRSTIISIIPKIVDEYKPTLFPGRFVIPAANDNDFELLVVEPSSWYLPSAIEKMPPTEVTVNSLELAKSIVQDYCSGIFMCDMGEAMPGLFFIPGEYSKITILAYTDRESGISFLQMLETARRKQKNWLLALVEQADVDWARTNGNPLSVSDDARIAARVLEIPDKAWMSNVRAASLVNCKACGEMINANFPVCKYCHAILDVDKAVAMGLQFALNQK